MLQKIINFYIVTVENQLQFQVIEMQQLDKSSPVTALTRANTLKFDNEIEAVVEAIYRNDLTSIQLLEPILEGRDVQLLDYFNQLPGSREENREQLRNQLYQIRYYRLSWIDWYIYTYKLMNNIKDETQVNINHLFGSLRSGMYDARENAYPWNEYAYFTFSGFLSNDPKSLLILIGSLDGLLSRLEQIALTGGYQFKFNFCDGVPQSDNHGLMIADAIKMANARKQPQSKSLARFISERIIDEVKKDPQALRHYPLAAEVLSKVMEKAKTPSLANIIYKILNPLPIIAEFIPTVLISAPCDLVLKLLNPSVPHVSASDYLIDWVRAQLKLENGDKIINAQINLVVSVRKVYWQRMLNSLFGLPAPDGGHYNRTYTELMLLSEASMAVNRDGLMVLDVKETDAYKQYYRDGACNHADLEKELRAVFIHLGFELQKKLDFHQEIVFTPKSSQALMDMGMHYSDRYIKSLTRISYNNLLFFNRNTTGNPLNALPNHVKARMIKFIEPGVDEAEIVSIGLRN